MIEADIRNTASLQQTVVRHGLYPEGQTLDRHLAADSPGKLKEALQCSGLPFENVAHRKPWMVIQEMVRNGFPTE